MAFPTTSVIDDFNRADAATLGANWTGGTITGLSPSIATNQAAPDATFHLSSDAYLNTATYGPDSEAFVDVPTVGTAAARVRLLVRFDPAGGGSGYVANFNPSTQATAILRVDSGAFTQLGATITDTFVDGDSKGIDVAGSAITVYRKPSAGAWGSVDSRTDATYTAAGNIGFGTSDAPNVIDNFGGGTVVAGTALPPLPTVVDTAVARAANY